MAKMTIDIDTTRHQIRRAFDLMGIDQLKWEISYQEDRNSGKIIEQTGAAVWYMRNNQWQSISCAYFPSRAQNLRQCYFLLDRLRIAEQNGVEYQGLTFTKDISTTINTEQNRQQDLMEADDILDARLNDPIYLTLESLRIKYSSYGPTLRTAFMEFCDMIIKSRGEK